MGRIQSHFNLMSSQIGLPVTLQEVPQNPEPLNVVPPEGVVVAVGPGAVHNLLPGGAARVDLAAPLVHPVHDLCWDN